MCVVDSIFDSVGLQKCNFFSNYLKVKFNRLKRKVHLEDKYTDLKEMFVFRIRDYFTVLKVFTFMPVNGKLNILIHTAYVTRIFGILISFAFVHIKCIPIIRISNKWW